MPNVLIRTDADDQIGFGHLYRCLTLADTMKGAEIEPSFVLGRATPEAISIISNAGFQQSSIPEGIPWFEEAEYLPANPEKNDFIVLDFSHRDVTVNAERLPYYLDKLSAFFDKIILIDSGGQLSIAQSENLKLDILLRPYVGEQPLPGASYLQLLGPDYFIAKPEFFASRRDCKDLAEKAHRILVTFGGSDPEAITLKVLDAINQINFTPLEIQVIVGPGFSKLLSDKIHGISQQSNFLMTVLYAPSSLAENMTWCDLAISGSGLTKYELAATGTPSIQLSIDQEHAELNTIFAKAGTTLDLGVHSATTTEKIAQAIEDLIADRALRQKMCENGSLLIDGRGANRIIETLKDLRPC